MAPTQKTCWSEDEDNLLRDLHKAGLSASKMLLRLPHRKTRSAIIGRLHRLGLSHAMRMLPKEKGSVPVKPTRVRDKSQAARVKVSPLTGVESLRALEKRMKAALPPDEPKIDLGLDFSTCVGVALLDLTPTCCRWPLNSPKPGQEYLFCGAVRFAGKPYCVDHCRIAYQAGTAYRSSHPPKVPVYTEELNNEAA